MVLLAILAPAPSAMLHAGHGESRWVGTLVHYVTEPVHLPLVLVAAAVLVLGTRRAVLALHKQAALARRP